MRFNRELFDRPSRHVCKKAGTTYCPNAYVKKACLDLDGNNQVLRFSYQSLQTTFLNPKEGKFFPILIDFDVQTRTGRKLIQIVPEEFLQDESILAQLDAIELLSVDLNASLEVWSEKQLFGTNPDYRETLIRFLC